MKVLFLLLYVIFSGMILGWGNNSASEFCGETQRMKTTDVIESLVWPMAIGAVMTLDEGRIITPLCDKE